MSTNLKRNKTILLISVTTCKIDERFIICANVGKWRHFLHPYHSVWPLVQVLAVPLLTQLTANVSGKVLEHGSRLWVPRPMWETQMVCQASNFSLVQPLIWGVNPHFEDIFLCDSASLFFLPFTWRNTALYDKKYLS